MTSRDRMLAAWKGSNSERAPLAAWCFGVRSPGRLRWERNGIPRRFWYSLRMEHLHALPQPWTLEDDFLRALAWQSLGVDDVLEISVPWSAHPDVSWTDEVRAAGTLDSTHDVIVRTYRTPVGELRHAVRLTGETPGEGWVVQPADHLPLFEDYNVPRGAKHAVSSPDDVPKVEYLYQAPDASAREWFEARAKSVGEFAREHGFAVQAWTGFGMDAVVWMAGIEGAVLLAMDSPKAFARLMEIILGTDLARTELAAADGGVDMVMARGWYSSTDFWSPALFDKFVLPYVRTLADATHRRGKLFGYVMTTGVAALGPRLADAGVDALYFVDPVQDSITLELAGERLSDRMCLVGGINSTRLLLGEAQIRDDVRRAMEILSPTGRFVLQPVDALFPDTPWEAVEIMIETWKEFR